MPSPDGINLFTETFKPTLRIQFLSNPIIQSPALSRTIAVKSDKDAVGTVLFTRTEQRQVGQKAVPTALIEMIPKLQLSTADWRPRSEKKSDNQETLRPLHKTGHGSRHCGNAREEFFPALGRARPSAGKSSSQRWEELLPAGARAMTCFVQGARRFLIV